ncbi:DUF3280 domain-containing protein [Methylocella silvestris]|uniref:DUF3280 domain-containing protein n=1 Tax=Methylocella silvestris TaxID=199596 RepID=UPI00164FA059|nr:DUF3280 domain-containing protein [Methylocella silvestris]
MTDRLVLRARRWLGLCGVALLMGALAPVPAGADPAPIAIAVFDFELDDFSGGAGIAGDHAADLRYLDQATSAARKLLAESGRYRLVDVAGADSEDAKARTLHQCNGCEAALAEKLGADQSFVGIVTRITRTDYVVRFQIRDAHTGAVVLARTSDLRIGADYSWARGAAALVRDKLLEGS